MLLLKENPKNRKRINIYTNFFVLIDYEYIITEQNGRHASD